MTIDFGKGEQALDEGALAHVKQFVAMLEKHGFGEVRITGHNAVLVGTYNALTMAAARADATAAALASELTIPTTVLAHGVRVTRAGFGSDDTRVVELAFR